MVIELEPAGARHGHPRAGKAIAALAVILLAAAFATWRLREAAFPGNHDRAHLSVAVMDFDGGRFTLESYRGRPTVVNFWSSSCPSCAAEMPAFEQVHRRFGESVEFVGINLSDRRSAAEELARSTGVTYRLAEDPQGQLYSAFGGIGMPTTALLGEDGDIAEVVVGQLSKEQLTSLIHEHLEVSI